MSSKVQILRKIVSDSKLPLEAFQKLKFSPLALVETSQHPPSQAIFPPTPNISNQLRYAGASETLIQTLTQAFSLRVDELRALCEERVRRTCQDLVGSVTPSWDVSTNFREASLAIYTDQVQNMIDACVRDVRKGVRHDFPNDSIERSSDVESVYNDNEEDSDSDSDEALIAARFAPILEKLYSQGIHHPLRHEKMLLAERSHMSYRRIGVWFQNRREREKELLQGKLNRTKSLTSESTSISGASPAWTEATTAVASPTSDASSPATAVEIDSDSDSSDDESNLDDDEWETSSENSMLDNNGHMFGTKAQPGNLPRTPSLSFSVDTHESSDDGSSRHSSGVFTDDAFNSTFSQSESESGPIPFWNSSSLPLTTPKFRPEPASSHQVEQVSPRSIPLPLPTFSRAIHHQTPVKTSVHRALTGQRVASTTNARAVRKPSAPRVVASLPARTSRSRQGPSYSMTPPPADIFEEPLMSDALTPFVEDGEVDIQPLHESNSIFKAPLVSESEPSAQPPPSPTFSFNFSGTNSTLPFQSSVTGPNQPRSASDSPNSQFGQHFTAEAPTPRAFSFNFGSASIPSQSNSPAPFSFGSPTPLKASVAPTHIPTFISPASLFPFQNPVKPSTDSLPPSPFNCSQSSTPNFSFSGFGQSSATTPSTFCRAAPPTPLTNIPPPIIVEPLTQASASVPSQGFSDFAMDFDFQSWVPDSFSTSMDDVATPVLPEFDEETMKRVDSILAKTFQFGGPTVENAASPSWNSGVQARFTFGQ